MYNHNNLKSRKNKVVELEKIEKIYIVGIEGAGTSALALILQKMGKKALGSDEGDHFYFEPLQKAGIRVFHEFSRSNLPEDIDLFIYSTAFNAENNEELKEIFKSRKNVLSYPEVLSLIFNQKYGIAVCGTHGKTTTTAMLATALDFAGSSPTALVGSKVLDWNGGALIGDSDYFILEADEYQNKFQFYEPKAVILTSLDYDHPDFFPDFKSYQKVFIDLIKKIPSKGFLVAFAGDDDVIKVAKSANCKVIFYGNITDEKVVEIKKDFEKIGKKVFFFGQKKINLKVPGNHNQLNANAGLALADNLGVNKGRVIDGLEKFSGTARRFQFLGKHKSGAEIIDDYAHHPREIQATLLALKGKYPQKNIICIFHPHTFTRTKALLNDFARSFENADEVILLDIFGSAREWQGSVSSTDLVKKINELTQIKKVQNFHTMEDVYDYLNDRLSDVDVVITMGAGDVWKLGNKFVRQ